MDTLRGRTAVELEQQLVAARERSRWSEHLSRHCAGVRATCEWLLGRATATPCTGVERAADEIVQVSATWTPDAVTLERMRGGHLEEDALRTGGDAVTLHGAVYTLAWYLREASADVAPLP